MIILVVVGALTLGVDKAEGSSRGQLATAAHFLLPKRAASKNFELVFPIPEKDWNKGRGWVSREIITSDTLGVVEECLNRDIYYVIVRLVGKAKQTSRGSLFLTLQKGLADTPFPPRLPAPTNLHLYSPPLQPNFFFHGESEVGAFRLFSLPDEVEIWSRGFTRNRWGHLDEGSLKVNCRYLLEARQGNAAARYSPPAFLEFKVIGIPRKCAACLGTGYLPRYPVTPPEKKRPCESCSGTGIYLEPALATAPAELKP